MNQEVKQKWVTALRSGKYSQGKYRLRAAENSFCCLGVLCDISGLRKWKYTDNDGYRYIKEGESSAEWTDIDYWAGFNLGEANLLSRYNDRGHSFEWIADYIEKNM